MSGAEKPLSFGYLYDFRNPEPWRRPPARLYAETIELAAATEGMGFAGAWVPEHHAADDGYMPTPHLALAAIAARTSTIRLGAAIALAPLYHPVRFAEECAVLDILSDGRFETALAIGYRRREYAMYGEAFGKRGARFDEFLHIVRALWRGETVSFTGEHFRIDAARIEPGPPRGHIPLYIGGFAEKALERVARYADGYFGNLEVCDLYMAKLAEQGRDPARAGIRIQSLFLAVADDPERAMAELAPYYHHVSNSYGAWMAEDKAIGLADPAMKPMDLDAFKASGTLTILTPDEAVAHFAAMRARMPVEHVMMMRPPGLSADRFADYAALFADKVMPRLAISRA
jgi:alkanesulfonate monooxygenase SsuD/methylene tetrahydromethanopterin reductase-like flavin-dependent oxidoreductase (luciferase family)